MIFISYIFFHMFLLAWNFLSIIFTLFFLNIMNKIRNNYPFFLRFFLSLQYFYFLYLQKEHKSRYVVAITADGEFLQPIFKLMKEKEMKRLMLSSLKSSHIYFPYKNSIMYLECIYRYKSSSIIQTYVETKSFELSKHF